MFEYLKLSALHTELTTVHDNVSGKWMENNEAQQCNYVSNWTSDKYIQVNCSSHRKLHAQKWANDLMINQQFQNE